MAGSKPRKNPAKRVRQAKQARSKATVEAVLEAATRILSDGGWSALTTNHVAEAAGVSVGSVYEYFSNKEGIVDQILERHLSRGQSIIEASAARVTAESTPEEIVTVVVDGFVGIHADDPQLHRVLSTEIPLSPDQRQRIESLRTLMVTLLTSALAGLVDTPEVKAALLIDTADALTHRWLVDELGTPVDTQVMAGELEKMLSLYVTQ